MEKENTLKYGYVASIVMVVAALSFFGGLKYGQQTTRAQMSGAGQQFRGGGAGGVGGLGGGATGRRINGNQGGGFVSGEILSKDDKSLTVKLRDGGSKIIFFSASTTIGKATAGSADDLQVGQQVMASGKTNSDGSVAADNVQIRPAMPTAPQPETAPTQKP